MDNLVFVYGTLRQGCSNHHLLKGETLLGPARTMDRFALYVDDFPYLIKSQPCSRVSGEVYRVGPVAFARLDALENHPLWYRRERRGVAMENGSVLQAWVYFFPVPRGSLVPSGDYLKSSLCCQNTRPQIF